MALLELDLPDIPLTVPENSVLPLPTIGLNLLGLPLLSLGLTGPDAEQFQVIDLGLGRVQITPAQPLDYETRGDRPFELGLQAGLGLLGLNLASAPFRITLTDVNDVAPANLRLTSDAPAPENVAGLTIGTLTADDPDTVGGPLTFEIVGGADAALFQIAEDGVTLTLRDGVALDYETAQTYDIQVRASDGANLSDLTSLVITALDQPEGTPLPLIPGTGGSDTLTGTPGADLIQAGGGDDTLAGGAGADILDGGSGTDIASYADSPAAVDVDLSGGIGLGGDAEGDALTGIENLIGSAFNDSLRGDDGANSLNGGDGDDTLEGRGGHDRLDGGAGTDTAIFSGALNTYQVSDQGQRVLVNGQDGNDVLIGIERLRFADGEVNLADGDPLFDTLFYYRNNPDVFAAGVDAKEHYNSSGFREGRNPNAFFDSAGYLSANKDVAAAGLNPLEHYRAYGAAEGRDPSARFDVEGYLALHPDVRGSGTDPLVHYLSFGLAEARSIVPAVGRQLSGNFDTEYYLLANPDVGAAGADPYTHWIAFGVSEGRNPNAFFDTRGYLAAYSDVAAAGVNPLEHFSTYGWREGRDPSMIFDTRDYLSRYGDVAAAGVDPLNHYLTYGVYEGRVALNDGMFG